MTEQPQCGNEQCDRCIARAVVIVRLPSFLVLAFCGHHYAMCADGLWEAGALVVIDDRELLTAGAGSRGDQSG